MFSPIKSEAGSFARYGLGVFDSADYGRASVKTVSFGYQEKIFGSIYKQFEAGLWTDSSGHGRTGSGFGSASLGLDVSPGDITLRCSGGLAAITSPDSMLGGWFQFTQDFLFGVHDRQGNLIGINYKHISSAGIYHPNMGRDFVTIQAEIPW